MHRIIVKKLLKSLSLQQGIETFSKIFECWGHFVFFFKDQDGHFPNFSFGNTFFQGEGCALVGRLNKFEQIIRGMNSVLDVPLTVKMRTGIFDNKNIAHTVIPKLRDWGVSMVTVSIIQYFSFTISRFKLNVYKVFFRVYPISALLR